MAKVTLKIPELLEGRPKRVEIEGKGVLVARVGDMVASTGPISWCGGNGAFARRQYIGSFQAASTEVRRKKGNATVPSVSINPGQAAETSQDGSYITSSVSTMGVVIGRYPQPILMVWMCVDLGAQNALGDVTLAGALRCDNALPAADFDFDPVELDRNVEDAARPADVLVTMQGSPIQGTAVFVEDHPSDFNRFLASKLSGLDVHAQGPRRGHAAPISPRANRALVHRMRRCRRA
ncbi:MAG: hypothetical protein ACREV4_04425, partial [Gammaproteobacteria bacterium]